VLDFPAQNTIMMIFTFAWAGLKTETQRLVEEGDEANRKLKLVIWCHELFAIYLP
jgi:hypothetical protein